MPTNKSYAQSNLQDNRRGRVDVPHAADTNTVASGHATAAILPPPIGTKVLDSSVHQVEKPIVFEPITGDNDPEINGPLSFFLWLFLGYQSEKSVLNIPSDPNSHRRFCGKLNQTKKVYTTRPAYSVKGYRTGSGYEEEIVLDWKRVEQLGPVSTGKLPCIPRSDSDVSATSFGDMGIPSALPPAPVSTPQLRQPYHTAKSVLPPAPVSTPRIRPVPLYSGTIRYQSLSTIPEADDISTTKSDSDTASTQADTNYDTDIDENISINNSNQSPSPHMPMGQAFSRTRLTMPIRVPRAVMLIESYSVFNQPIDC